MIGLHGNREGFGPDPRPLKRENLKRASFGRLYEEGDRLATEMEEHLPRVLTICIFIRSHVTWRAKGNLSSSAFSSYEQFFLRVYLR